MNIFEANSAGVFDLVSTLFNSFFFATDGGAK
jgi:hypothetical protein